MWAVFVREDAAFEFARFDGCGDGVVIDGPEEEGSVVRTTKQVECAVFSLCGVFEDGEEEFGLGFDAGLTKGECENLGLLGFVFRCRFLEFELALFGIADTEGEDFIGIIGGMPGALQFGWFQFHGSCAEIVCHIGLRAGGEQGYQSDAGEETDEGGFHIVCGDWCSTPGGLRCKRRIMWWSYEDVQEQKKRLQREIAKRKKRGETFEPLPAPAGQKKLCTTFWGQAWYRNLESYQQYESRLPRGRSYLRQGNVYNLEIASGKLTAVVAGSELYDTSIYIQPLPKKLWKQIVEQGSGQVGTMLDLLAGKLGDGLMRILTDPQDGLFPKPKEIRFDCNCPDHADMCKHVSAVLYGVGVMLDTKPELLFTLRGVDQAELLANASNAAITDLSADSGDLAGADLSAIFGIDLATDVSLPMVEEPKSEKKVRRKKSKPESM